MTLYAWLAGLAVNALTAFSASLPERFKWAHPRTLRRWWFNFPADLYLTDRALFVVLHPRWFRSWWEQKVDVFCGPRCGGRRRVLAYLTQGSVIRRILGHLHQPELPPPQTPARWPRFRW